MYSIGMVLVLAFLGGCAFWAASIAERKGRDRGPWFILGLLFGPLGVLIAGLVGTDVRARTDIPPL